MVFDATVGGASANSYVTVAEANTYFSGHPYSSNWNTVDKEVHLVYATNLLDSMVEWIGDVETTTQSLNWPRTLSDTTYDGIIPTKVKNATFELALHLASNTELFDNESLEKLVIGPIKLDFNVDNVIQMFPRIVLSMIAEFGSIVSGDASAIQTPKLIRV